MERGPYHDLFDYSPIVDRPPLRWPNGAHVAVWIVPNIEHAGFDDPAERHVPNVPVYSQRDYGNRVGVFRLAELLARHGIVATAAIDARSALERSEIVRLCSDQGWEFAAHGEAVTRLISSQLDEAEERRQIRASLDAIERASGRKALGWHGPESGESARTPAILAELGVRYVLDWPNDELPYTMRTSSGPLVAVPMAIDLDDVFATWHRKLSMPRWARSVSDALDRLLADGATQPRTLVLNLHPWLIGQPWRISYLSEVLADLRRRDGIWFATAGEIADWHSRRDGAAR